MKAESPQLVYLGGKRHRMHCAGKLVETGDHVAKSTRHL